MANYRIIVLPTEECNPEYAPGKALQEGVEVDGFAIMMQRKDEPCSETIMGINVDIIRNWMRNRTKVGNIFRAAAGMADADIRAMELLEENKRKEHGLSEILKMFMEGAGHGD